MLEYQNDEEHPYSKIYKAFLLTVNYKELWKSLVKQYKYLLKEITNQDIEGELPCKLWLERNLREQSEVLQCLILLAEPAKVSIKDWSMVFNIFNKNGFGRVPSCRQAHVLIDTPLFDRLIYTQIAVLLSMAKELWENPEEWQQEEEREILDSETLELQSFFVEHALTQYIWIMLNLVHERPQEQMNKYMKLLEEIEKQNIFSLFLKCLQQPQFEESSLVGIRIKECIYDLLQITIARFDNEQGTLIDTAGLSELTAEVFKNRKIVQRIFESPSGLVQLWMRAHETFPVRFPHLTLFAQAITSTGPEYAQEVISCNFIWTK